MNRMTLSSTSTILKRMNDSNLRVGQDTTFAAELIKEGKLVAIPTETVYGLAADATSIDALNSLYKAKGRPSSHPVIVHIPNTRELENWVTDTGSYGKLLADRFWPGPLTLVLRRKSTVLDQITGGQDTVALRIPDHPLTIELLTKLGGAIAAPSANKFGKLSPTTPQDVDQEFGKEVSYILDGGNCDVGIESTIIDISTDRPRILRPGKISRSEIEDLLKTNVHSIFEDQDQVPAENNKIRTPGDLPSHYAPEKPLYLVESTDLDKVIQKLRDSNKNPASLSFRKLLKEDSELSLVSKLDQTDYARNLYSSLRSLDNSDCDLILVESPPKDSSWAAINDRLKRAAKGKL